MDAGAVRVTAFDVAVVGAPFVDLTFAGLEHLPAAGEEVIGQELRMGPGGTGMQAVALARLGLSTALVSPVGADVGGRMLRSIFADEDVTWLGPEVNATPTTAILSTPGGAAMATAPVDAEPSRDDVVAADAGAVVLSLGRMPLRPPNAAAYATTGTVEVEAGVRPDETPLEGTRALILNEDEAVRISGARDASDAAARLVGPVRSVVVTLGAGGALAVEGGREVRASAPSLEAVDATGAGDLFVAAYVWADLAGFGTDARLAWACLYAGLSVRAPTALDGALRLDELLSEGKRRRMPGPKSGARP
jgi:sugar/nucleoside kinase (ribokinase family)